MRQLFLIRHIRKHQAFEPQRNRDTGQRGSGVAADALNNRIAELQPLFLRGTAYDRDGLNGGVFEQVAIDLQRFVGNLKTAWPAGETRPTHRRPYRRTKPLSDAVQ